MISGLFRIPAVNAVRIVQRPNKGFAYQNLTGALHDPTTGIHHIILLRDNSTDRNDNIPDPYLEKGEENMSWIGPRRAMLLIAIVMIGIGWYFRDYTINIFGESSNVGGILVVVGLAFIGTTILYSVLTTC